MKLIIVDGKEYYYKVTFIEETGFTVTFFYTKEGKISVYKYNWFKRVFLNKKQTELVDNYVFAFRLNFNIESKKFTKSEVKGEIVRQIKLLNREEEIAKGEII